MKQSTASPLYMGMGTCKAWEQTEPVKTGEKEASPSLFHIFYHGVPHTTKQQDHSSFGMFGILLTKGLNR